MRGGAFLGFLVLAAALLGWVDAAAADAPKSGAPGAVEWQVGDGLFLAGRDLTFSRDVDGSLTITGETVEVTREARVKGDIWIAGRRVAYEGDGGGDLAIRAQDALINGHVKGDVSFYGVNLAFGPDARIDGAVHYFAAGPAEVDAGAQIKGGMKSSMLREDGRAVEYDWRDRWAAPGYRISWAGAIFFGILAGIAALVAPESAARLREAAVGQPGYALAAGLLWLVGTPILAVIALITIVGLPLALVIVLLWPFGIVMGLVASILVLGEILSGHMTAGVEGATRRILGVAAATIVLWIGISLPALGGLVWLGAVTLGIGAVALAGRVRFTAI
ncbi:MAG: polymer-forming cytoskeletal protein [Parvibaculum sp.]|jgi:cytoskeletal protein CcmA (bactofilin family)|uniref:polymer-forming cytoskeletal protein n=1 Tax=Parvibaculum sp. TaxID=2024848 RepID=UPI00283CBCC4|nr:polymer-forming cytoskeletal protein [Parvibaculum sp.]MDR3499123.1 polymer-forming cytoskeletal protein [Parvibaculum sp.]